MPNNADTSPKHNVAVYGSLKHGQHNAHILSSSKLIGREWLVGWKMLSLGAFPGAVVSTEKVEGNWSRRHEMLVELYEVDDLTFDRLDQLEGYPRFYDRKQITTESGITAWMYFLDESKYSDCATVTSGEW